MKKWEKEIIVDNFSALTDNTKCSDELLNHLTFLTQSEKEECGNQFFPNVNRATKLYNWSMSRVPAYKNLIRALHATKQDAAKNILMNVLKLKEPLEWEILHKELNPDDLDGATGSNPGNQVEPPLVSLETLRTDPELKEQFPKEVLDHIIDGRKLEINFKESEQEKLEKDSDDKKGAIYLPKDASKGLAAIINIVDFDESTQSSRESSVHDVINLKSLFYETNYKVFPSIKRQLEGREKTKADIERLIVDFKAECEKEMPASIIFFLGSHGDYHNEHGPRICTSDLHDIKVTDVLKEFHRSNCPPALQKIPKLFLIQACQCIFGEKDAAGITEDSEEYNITTFQATSPGGSAYRTPYLGSWLVLCFLSAMMQHAREKHLLEILEIAKEKMELLRSKKIIPWDQQPSLEHFTLKNIYFNI